MLIKPAETTVFSFTGRKKILLNKESDNVGRLLSKTEVDELKKQVSKFVK